MKWLLNLLFCYPQHSFLHQKQKKFKKFWCENTCGRLHQAPQHRTFSSHPFLLSRKTIFTTTPLIMFIDKFISSAETNRLITRLLAVWLLLVSMKIDISFWFNLFINSWTHRSHAKDVLLFNNFFTVSETCCKIFAFCM